VAGACTNDPSLAIDVVNPPGLAIASTQVTVYQSDVISCNGVVFGDLDATQLAALQVAQETLGSNGRVTSGSLDGMSRTDNKVIVARGFDGSNNWIAAGCGSAGVISDGSTLTIDTEGTVAVSLEPPDAAGNDPYGVDIATTDPYGSAVAGRQISWTVFGPTGTVPYTSASSFDMIAGSDGGEWQPNVTCTNPDASLVAVHPMFPNLTGGYAVQMRVEWANAPIPQFTDLGLSQSVLQSVHAAGHSHYCAVHATGGANHVACFDDEPVSGIVVHDFAYGSNAQGSAVLNDVADETPPNGAVALVAEPGSGSDTDIYVVDAAGGVTPMFPLGATVPAGTAFKIGGIGSGAVDDAIFEPGCGSDGAHVVVHAAGTLLDEVYELDPAGGNALLVKYFEEGSEPFSQLVSAGCIGQLGSDAPVQVLAIDIGRTKSDGVDVDVVDTFALHDCVPGTLPTNLSCADVPLFPGAGVGFTQTASPHLLAATVTASGVEIEEVVLSGGSAQAPVEVAAVPSAALPDHIVTGNFDSSGQLDQLWDMVSSRRGGSTFEIAYTGQLVGTLPLEALSPNIPATSVDDILVADVNGDGVDDVIVTVTTTLGTAGSGTGAALAASNLLVVPMGIPQTSGLAIVPDGSACPLPM
jgi:hypothetical protein